MILILSVCGTCGYYLKTDGSNLVYAGGAYAESVELIPYEGYIPAFGWFRNEFEDKKDFTNLTYPDFDRVKHIEEQRTALIDVTELEFENIVIDDVEAFRKKLEAYPRLKSVKLRSCDISMDNKKIILSMEEKYSIAWYENLAGVDVDNLCEEVDISGHGLTDLEGFRNSLRNMPNLKKIIMCDCNLSNEQMEQLINEFPNIRFVWRIQMGQWSLRSDSVAFSTFQDKISYRMNNNDAYWFKYCTDMVALDLGHNRVTDISFLQYMPNLKILILVDNMADGGGFIRDLSMIKNCPKLEYFEVFVGSATDFSFLEYTPNVKDLNISYNPISDINYLTNLPHIERLFIEHTGLSEDDYHKLQELYPNAQVVLYGQGSIDNGWRTHERYYAMRNMLYNNIVDPLFAD